MLKNAQSDGNAKAMDITQQQNMKLSLFVPQTIARFVPEDMPSPQKLADRDQVC
jgi:hypothetical protein